MSEKPPPDFAMLRAVEILAQMHETMRRKPGTRPPALDRSVILRSERIAFEVGKTRRVDVERDLGIAFSYPFRGWHTYATKEGTHACLLSAFYKDACLVAVELYVPRSQNAPALAARDYGGFRLEPGSVAIGMRIDAIASIFTPAVGGPARVVYESAVEARFPGGVAYAMAHKGMIERLAVYADTSSEVA
jgi:hypothetical protein